MMSEAVHFLKRSVKYGSDNRGKLRTIIMHTPQKQIDFSSDINAAWYPAAFNDDAILEFEYLCQFFQSMGIEIIHLDDLISENSDLIATLPNLIYPGYTAVISTRGAFISRMKLPHRRNEEFVVKELLENLSIPVVHEFQSTDNYFEGFVPFDQRTLFLTATEHHHSQTIMRFIQEALVLYDDIILLSTNVIPECSKPDTVFNKIGRNCAIYSPSSINNVQLFRRYTSEQINLEEYSWKQNIELIPVSQDEQSKNACSCVSIDDETIAHFDSVFAPETLQKFRYKNIRVVTFKSYHLQYCNSSMSSYMLPVYRY
jgi:arginine deiminase